MATTRAVIRIRKDNEGHIHIMYGHKSLTALFSTGVKSTKEQWNENKQTIDKTKGIKDNQTNAGLIPILQKESTLCNALIKTIQARVNTITRELQIKDIDPLPSLVKSEYQKKYKTHKEEAGPDGFFPLFDKFIEGQRSLKAESTINQYRSVYNNLISYEKIKKEKITLETINTGFYERLVKYFMEEHPMRDDTKGMNNNSIGTQIKRLKVFLGHLKKQGLINTDLSDFKVFKEDPEIIFLSQEELDLLYNHKFEDPNLSFHRDLFVLQCYTSLRVSDLQRLGKQHIQDGVIRMRAHKTKRNIMVPLLPVTKEILERYNYQLPKFYDQQLNEHIKTACKLAGIDSEIELQESKGGKKVYNTYKKWELISTHIGVKTFITLMLQNGMQPKEVAGIVGKTTKIIDKNYHGLDNTVILNKAQNVFNKL
jgi:integrase